MVGQKNCARRPQNPRSRKMSTNEPKITRTFVTANDGIAAKKRTIINRIGAYQIGICLAKISGSL